MDTGRELFELEHELLEPTTRHSRPRLEQLLHESFIEVGVSGQFWTRTSIIDALLAEATTSPIAAAPVEEFRVSPLHSDGTLMLAQWSRAGV
jgi:hypothetical protein